MEENAQQASPTELLTKLKSYPFLAPYNLNLFSRRKNFSGEKLDCEFKPCGSVVQDPLSNEIGLNFIAQSLKPDLPGKKTSVYRYNGGFLSFVICFGMGDTDFCLVGNGVRDKLIDFWQLERLSKADKVDAFSLLNQLEKLPVATVHELEEVAEHIHGMLPALQQDDDYRSLYDQAVNRLSMVVGLLEQVDGLKSVNELVSLTTDLLTFLFNFPKVALALLDADREFYSVAGKVGLEEMGNIPAGGIRDLLGEGRVKKTQRFHPEAAALFTGVTAESIILFPLRTEGADLGFISIFDGEPQALDLLMIELLAAKVAARMRHLKKETEHLQLSALSNKLLSVTNTLLFAENKEDLYKTILELAADLLSATQGSIMLMDKSGENLHIVFTMGMSLHLAQCMTVKVGRGIAGKVAKTGIPLLIDDIEKDSRVGIRNRPRFKSKALICIPLKLKDKVIGVLNLSDKEDLGAFTESDKDLLTSFANLASLIIERTLVIEESVIFEKMAVTDALTGLYNRRFLKNRLEEELNRSIRQKLNLTILFIDLDHFKIYNDLCGHIAGDEALRKTAVIIKASLRDMDVVARYGGEEFCAILPGTSKGESLAVAERIRAGIEKEAFPMEEKLPLGRLTTSIGVASFPEDGHTFTSLIHAADVALYEAKTAGRNTIVVARHMLDNV